MRIVDLQRRLRERGRIRLGYSTPSKKDPTKKVPHKLETFRFTAADRDTICQVAELYGGTPEQWAEGGAADQWQVVTAAKELGVVFATEVAFSQSYEQFAGGFLRRICDGETAMVPSSGQRFAKEPCACDPDERACQITTHLKLILPDLAGLGTWRLVSHGYNAAVELLAAVELIEGALGAGLVRVPARLMVEKREKRRLVVADDGTVKPMTLKFHVPVLELQGSVAALGPATAGTAIAPLPAGPGVAALAAQGAQAALPAPARPAPTGWKPVEQQALPEGPVIPIGERLAPPAAEAPRRKNSAPPIPPTGRRPRTGDQAESAERCPRCSKPYGGEAVVRNPDPGPRYIHRSCRSEEPAGEDPGTEAAADGATVPAAGDDGAAGSVALPLAPAGGAETGDAPDPAPPVPAKKRAAARKAPAVPLAPETRMMSHAQHAKVMALSAKAFAKLEGESQEQCDGRRRATVLAMCAALGQPGMESRSEITAMTAGPLIEGLSGIEEGRLGWDGERFVATDQYVPTGPEGDVL